MTWIDWMDLLEQRDLDVIALRTGFVRDDGSFDSSKMEEFERACTAERLSIVEDLYAN